MSDWGEEEWTHPSISRTQVGQSGQNNTKEQLPDKQVLLQNPWENYLSTGWITTQLSESQSGSRYEHITKHNKKEIMNNNRVTTYTSQSGAIVPATRVITSGQTKVIRPGSVPQHSTIIATQELRMNQSDFMMGVLLNGETCVWESVEETTKKLYKTAWNRFTDFCKFYGTDVRMITIPESWTDHTNKFNTYYSFEESVAIGYLNYLRFEGSCICPKAASSYLSGVKFMWQNIGVRTTLIDESLYIKRCKTGMTKLWRKEKGNTAAEKACKPLVWEMITVGRKHLFSKNKKLDNVKARGVTFGYVTIGRICEIVERTDTDHHFRTQHAVFDVLVGGVICRVDAETIHEYDIRHIKGITVTIGMNGTKNDQDSEADSYYYPIVIQKEGEPEQFCFTSMMYDQACEGRPRRDESFFTINTDARPWKLTYEHYNQTVKLMASLCGVKDTKGYTPKSTRVGAASALAAAGMPGYIIQFLGRWSSLAFMEYIRLSMKQFEVAMCHLTNPDTLTHQDMVHSNPVFFNTK
jgi:hypothetical protein